MATRTSPAKRTDRPKPKAKPADTDIPALEPLRITTRTATEADTVPLFYIDGTEYRVPKRVPRGITLEFIRLERTLGEDAAVQRLLERLLGPSAYEALEQCDEIGDEEMEQIAKLVVAHAAGPVEPGKGGS
jgi:hypothetical protein